VQRLIEARAEGNPFYIEEVTRSLLEEGLLARTNGGYCLQRRLDTIHIPGTIEEVILSRIDRLEPPARGALQFASVIGREFTARLLRRVSDLEAQLDQILAELGALELIREKARLPELAYTFKHALTQDVTYSTLLQERRRALHRVVAAAIEELYPDRLPEQYETLAHHYSEGEQWEKALEYLVKAGQKAAQAFANQGALDYYARALEVCERLGDAQFATFADVGHRRAFVNFGIGRFPEAADDMDRVVDASRRMGDCRLEGLALAQRSLCELYNHQYETAERTLQRALALAQEGGFPDVRAQASVFLTTLYVFTNRHPDAEPLAAFVRGHAAELKDPFAKAFWAMFNSRLELWAGRPDLALALADEAREVSAPFIYTRLNSRWNEAHTRATRGEYEAALRILDQTMTACRRVGDVVVLVRCLNTVGYVYGELQDFERAMEWNLQGIEQAQAIHAPVPEVEMNAVLNLAENLLAVGRLDEAEERFREVEAVVRHPKPGQDWMRWRYTQRFLHSFGEDLLARGDVDEALRHADECLAMAEHSRSHKNIAKARRLRGQALVVQGRLKRAQEDLAIAVRMAAEVGSPPQIWKSHGALAELRTAQGDAEAARRAYADALAVIDAVAAGLTDARLRASLLGSDEAERIRPLAG
jgi:tetratricopeptide (TPR) repeat protein